MDIGERAFRGCKELLKIKLDNVKRIGDRAFEFCKNLIVEGLQNVEKVDESAFAGVPFPKWNSHSTTPHNRGKRNLLLYNLYCY